MLSKENKENLLKLADGIEGIPDEFFHMRNWRSDISSFLNSFALVSFRNIDDCGTAGCAVGWGPFIEGLEGLPEEQRKEFFEYGLYTERLFGLGECTDEFDWCFAASWDHVDNTARGAALRIREFIRLGKVPIDFTSQRLGHTPYMFKDILAGGK